MRIGQICKKFYLETYGERWDTEEIPKVYNKPIAYIYPLT